MNIACIGWGSLVWNPQDLPIQRYWFKDGPLLPIEFARHSINDCITLVIVPNARYVRTLWALMIVDDIEIAKIKLAEREGIKREHITKHIAYWNGTGSYGKSADIVGRWASPLRLDAVVWTNLPPKFSQEERVPSAEEVISFLKNLSSEKRKQAEEYIRRTPPQVDTEYRRQIEVQLNWTPMGQI